jgi:hypothetical protein
LTYGELWVAIGKRTELFDLLLALLWWEKSISSCLELISHAAGGTLQLATNVARRLLGVAYERGHGGRSK